MNVYTRSKARGAFDTFAHAFEGLIHTVEHQRNMRVHMLAALLVGLVGCALPLGLAEKVTLIFCVLLVVFAEILNTALEHLVDLAVEQLHEKARLTKDAAAAGVLVLAIGTVVIFAALVVHNWAQVVESRAALMRAALLGAPLAACHVALMAPARRPEWLDLLLFASGSALLGAVALHSKSDVFSALTYGVFALGGVIAWRRRRRSR